MPATPSDVSSAVAPAAAVLGGRSDTSLPFETIDDARNKLMRAATTANRMPDWAAELIGGTVGGFGQALVGHPFDTLKWVRLQTSSRYSGGWDCFKQTIKDEGVRGLYKGIGSPLLGNGFCNAVIFGVNGQSRRWVADGAHEDHLTPKQYALAGAITGFVVAFVNCPFEAIKVRLQTQYSTGGQQLYSGVFDCARKVFASRGIAGLYRGISITVIREIPSFAGYFGTYEIAKGYMWGDDRTRTLSNTEVLIAGGLAGIGAWVPCYMQDVVKSRMQSNYDYKTTMDAVRDVWRTNGFRGFWKGIGPTLARAFPANAATFFVYNLVMEQLNPDEELGHRIEFN